MQRRLTDRRRTQRDALSNSQCCPDHASTPLAYLPLALLGPCSSSQVGDARFLTAPAHNQHSLNGVGGHLTLSNHMLQSKVATLSSPKASLARIT